MIYKFVTNYDPPVEYCGPENFTKLLGKHKSSVSESLLSECEIFVGETSQDMKPCFSVRNGKSNPNETVADDIVTKLSSFKNQLVCVTKCQKDPVLQSLAAGKCTGFVSDETPDTVWISVSGSTPGLASVLSDIPDTPKSETTDCYGSEDYGWHDNDESEY